MVPKRLSRRKQKEKRQNSPFKDNEITDVEDNDSPERNNHNSKVGSDNFSMNIKPPKPLVVTSGSEMTKKWTLWLKQFRWYTTAVNLKNTTMEKQIAIFMSLIGEDAIEIFESFDIDEGSTDLEHIISKFNSYFEKKTNVIYERFVFNNLSQCKGETFNDFLAKASNQANKCAYGSMKDNLLRDRLVCGIEPDDTRQKLFNEENLTLEKTINICRTSEAMKRQLLEMSTKKSCPVFAVQSKHQATGTTNKNQEAVQSKQQNTSKNPEENTFECSRCASRHGPRSCPAFQRKCSNCGIPGHFSKVCRKKPRNSIKSLHTEDPVDKDGELYLIQSKTDQVNVVGSWLWSFHNDCSWLPISRSSSIQHIFSFFKFSTDSPSTDNLLQPEMRQNVRVMLENSRKKSRYYSNRTKRICTEFEEGENVLYRRGPRDWQPATVVVKGPEPRSYIVETQEGNRYRRNSWFLKKSHNQSSDLIRDCQHGQDQPEVLRRSTRITKLPERFYLS